MIVTTVWKTKLRIGIYWVIISTAHLDVDAVTSEPLSPKNLILWTDVLPIAPIA